MIKKVHKNILFFCAGCAFFAFMSINVGSVFFLAKETFAAMEWSDTRPPARNSVNPNPPNSESFSGIELTGIGGSLWHNNPSDYIAADTFYLQWGRDGKLYTPVTDGTLTLGGSTISLHSYDVSGKIENGQMYFECTENLPDGRCNPLAMRGQFPVNGSSTLASYSSQVIKYSDTVSFGRYPAANLVIGPGPGGANIWFYNTYLLNDYSGACGTQGWCKLGAMIGFRYSLDEGKSWSAEPTTPLFSSSLGARPKFGAAHFVDMGQNGGLDAMGNVVSGDNYAYLVSGGTDNPNDESNWLNTKAVYMARISLNTLRTAPSEINNISKWQVWNGTGWSTATLDVPDAQPVASYDSDGSFNMMGNAAVSFNKPLNKFFMVLSRSGDGRNTTNEEAPLTNLDKDFFNLMILESSAVTGPYKLVTYLRNFGPQAYFANIPSRFISADGMSFYLLYSANYLNVLNNQPLTPSYAGYAPTFTEMALVPKNSSTINEVDDNLFTYTGVWKAENCAPIPSYMPVNRVFMKTCHWNQDPSASAASYTFSGTYFKLYGIADPNHGTAEILIDNISAGQANFNNATRLHKAVFEKTGLAPGSHTIKIMPSVGVIALDKLKYGGENFADTTAPSVPTGLSASAISTSAINLSWTASTDVTGVTGYRIYRNGVQIGTSVSNSYSDSNLSPSTLYSYTVSAYDAAGNTSSQSSSASATTQSSQPVAGDLNSDHIVNTLDHSLLNSKWLQNFSSYDLQADGLINSLDFAILSSNWGKTW